MPKYRVDTDRGAFMVELNHEPATPQELHSLLSQHFAGQAPAAPPTPPRADPLGAIEALAAPQQRLTGNPLIDLLYRPLVAPVQRAINVGGQVVEAAVEQAPRLFGVEAASTPVSRYAEGLATQVAPWFVGAPWRTPLGPTGLARPGVQQPPVNWLPPPKMLTGQVTEPPLALRAAVADAQGRPMPMVPPPAQMGPPTPASPSAFAGPGIPLPESSLAAERFFWRPPPGEVFGPPPPPPTLPRPSTGGPVPISGAPLPSAPGTPTALDIGFQRAGELPRPTLPPAVPQIVLPGQTAPPSRLPSLPGAAVEGPPASPILDAFGRPLTPPPPGAAAEPALGAAEVGMARRGLGEPIVPQPGEVVRPQPAGGVAAVPKGEPTVPLTAPPSPIPPGAVRAGVPSPRPPIPPPIVTAEEQAAIAAIGRPPAATPVQGPLPLAAAPTRLHTAEEWQALQQLPRPILNEQIALGQSFTRAIDDPTGRAKLGITAPLAGAAVGGAIGGMHGDTPQDRIGSAALGVLAGFSLASFGTVAAAGKAAASTTFGRRMGELAPKAAGIDAKVGTAAARAAAVMGAKPPTTLDAIQRLASAKDPKFAAAFQAELAKDGLNLLDAGRVLMDNPNVNAAAIVRATSSVGRHIQEAALNGDSAAQRLMNAAHAERLPASTTEMMSALGRAQIDALRGLLVSAWRTAARNLLVQQVTTVGAETLHSTLDASIAKAFGLSHLSTIGYTQTGRYARDYFATLGGELGRIGTILPAWVSQRLGGVRQPLSTAKTEQLTQILAAYPRIKNQLYQRYASDVLSHGTPAGPGFAKVRRGGRAVLAPVGGETRREVMQLYEGVDTGVNVLNLANRTQEFPTRSAAFLAHFDRAARAKGLNPDALNIARDGAVIEPLVVESMEHALKGTMASTPKLDATSWFERFAARRINAMESSLGEKAFWQLFAGVYYPRFLWNSYRYMWERPFGSAIPAFRAFTKLMTPAGRAAVEAGDVRALSRAIEGAGELLVGYQIAKHLGGDELLDIKIPDRGQFNIGPLLPISAPVILGRIVVELERGTLSRRIPELTKTLTELSARVGQTAGAVPHIVKALAEGNEADWMRSSRGVQRFVGETAAGVLQPLTTLQMLLGTYGQYLPMLDAEWANQEGVRRDVSVNPLTDPLVARFPGASQLLPAKREWLRAGPLPKEEPPTMMGVPISADVSGLLVRKPTAVQSEAKRLGMKFAEIQGTGMGDPRADLLVRALGSERAEPIMQRVISAPGYQRADDAVKAAIFAEGMRAIREETNKAIMQRIGTKPAAQWSREERAYVDAYVRNAIPPRLRTILRERGVNIK